MDADAQHGTRDDTVMEMTATAPGPMSLAPVLKLIQSAP